LPHEYGNLTPNELNALILYKKREKDSQVELAAFTGFEAISALALLMNDKLRAFTDFFQIPKPARKLKRRENSLEDIQARCRRRGLRPPYREQEQD